MAGFYTYKRYAEWLRKDLSVNNDPAFAIRALKQVVSHIRAIPDDVEFENAHVEPPTTGDPNWDRVIRAAAEMTYTARFGRHSLSWVVEESEPADWFFPTGRPSRFAFNLARTPNAFLKRQVCLGEGNLRTAQDAEHTWT